MKNNHLTLIFICFVLPFLAFRSAEKGFNYTSSEGGFEVVFPSQYKIEAIGSSELPTVKVSSSIGEQTYFATYAIHQAELTGKEDLEDISLKSFSENLGGEVINKSEWYVKKNKGMQSTIVIEEQAVTIRYHVILLDNIHYQIIVVGKSSGFDHDSADEFFKSFKFDR